MYGQGKRSFNIESMQYMQVYSIAKDYYQLDILKDIYQYFIYSFNI